MRHGTSCVPTLGESVTEATVGHWFKKAGDAVNADEPLVELETDKVTLEVNAPAAGVLSAIACKPGETVAVGAVLGAIGEGAGRPPRRQPPIGQACRKRAAPAPANGRGRASGRRTAPLSPAVRKARRREAASTPPPSRAPARTAAS